MYRKLIIMLPLLLAGVLAYGQNVTLDAKGSKLSISGTSTLHDWTIEATSLEGEATVRRTDDGLLVDNLTFSVTVKGLESGKRAMDTNTYDALKEGGHPTIAYVLDGVDKVVKTKGGYLLSTTGQLTIAGMTCRIRMEVKASHHPQGYIFSGSLPLKMTDYSVEPPTALMGTVKTGNEVDITFNVRYK